MNDAILTKIKKCLALSKSSNIHEAQSALRQAQKLMQSNGITQETLLASETTEIRIKSKTKSKIKPWQNYLCVTIDHIFGTKTLFLREYDASYILILGTDTAVQMAKYAFDVLTRQIEKDKKIFVATLDTSIKGQTKSKMVQAYYLGYVHELYTKIESIAPAYRNDASIAQYQDDVYNSAKRTQTRSRTKTYSYEEQCALNSGRAMGKNANLHSGMAGDEKLRLQDR